jgi:hypothetical protein
LTVTVNLKDKTMNRQYYSSSILLACCFVFVIIITAIACDNRQPMKVEQTENTEYKVELLFVHNGCNIYRFEDQGRYIYYTDCRGKVEYSYTVSDGKTSHTEYVQNLIVR